MGKTNIALIDALAEAEEKKKKAGKERAKSETDKANGEVENTLPVIPSASEESPDLNAQSRDSSPAEPVQNDKVKKPPAVGPASLSLGEAGEARQRRQKPGKQKKVRSKKYQEVSKDLDRSKTYGSKGDFVKTSSPKLTIYF